MSYSLQIAGSDGRTRRQCVNVCDICLSWPKSELHEFNLSSQERILWLSTGLWSWEEGFSRKKLTSWKRYHRPRKRLKRKQWTYRKLLAFRRRWCRHQLHRTWGSRMCFWSHCHAIARTGAARACALDEVVRVDAWLRSLRSAQVRHKHTRSTPNIIYMTSWGEL